MVVMTTEYVTSYPFTNSERMNVRHHVKSRKNEGPSNFHSSCQEDITFRTVCRKKSAFGTWKKVVLVLAANGDVLFYTKSSKLRGAISQQCITRRYIAVPGEDPDPPFYVNAFVLAFEVTISVKRLYFLLNNHEELMEWMFILSPSIDETAKKISNAKSPPSAETSLLSNRTQLKSSKRRVESCGEMLFSAYAVLSRNFWSPQSKSSRSASEYCAQSTQISRSPALDSSSSSTSSTPVRGDTRLSKKNSSIFFCPSTSGNLTSLRTQGVAKREVPTSSSSPVVFTHAVYCRSTHMKNCTLPVRILLHADGTIILKGIIDIGSGFYLREILEEELICVIERCTLEQELNTAALITYSERFVLFFYDLHARMCLIQQLMRRLTAPRLFICLTHFTCREILLESKGLDLNVIRSQVQQFARPMAEVMQLPFNHGLDVPYVVAFLLSHLIQVQAYTMNGLFRTPGLTSTVNALRNAIDSSSDILLSPNEEDVHNAAGLLKLYLRTVPEPLIPAYTWDLIRELLNRNGEMDTLQYCQGDVNQSIMKDIHAALMTIVPVAQRLTVQFIFCFLHEIHIQPHSMKAEDLATLWSVTITPAAHSSQALLEMPLYVRPIQFLIENYPAIWIENLSLDSDLHVTNSEVLVKYLDSQLQRRQSERVGGRVFTCSLFDSMYEKD